MPFVSKTSSAAKMALVYITVGALLVIWSGLTMYYDPPTTNLGQLFTTGLLLTGVALFIIGLAVGQIGRSAKPADLPAEPATVSKTDNNGNQVTQTPAGTVPAAPVMAPGVTPVVMQPPAPVLPAGTPTVPASPPRVLRG